MSFFKKVLKRTPFYNIIEQRYYKNKALEWTEKDQEMYDFYKKFTPPSGLVFDVGANVGNRTKIFLKKGLKVVAIEPQDQCVKILKSCFGENKSLIIIQKVLGSEFGEAKLMISNSSTISSLSREWIQAVKKSGRFSNYTWDKTQVVPMVTLDFLIDSYGIPDFIKIDVEGFEYEVISGLSKSVKFISFEFVPEIISPSIKCIDHLESLGDAVFNYSIGESMELALDQYVSASEMKHVLNSYKGDVRVFGDVYCKFIKA